MPCGGSSFGAYLQIKEYVFEDPDFELLFKGWAKDNCHYFDLSTPVEEHTLKHTELHQQVRCAGVVV